MIYNKRVYYKTNTNLLNQTLYLKIKNLLLENDIFIVKIILFLVFLVVSISINSSVFYIYKINLNKKVLLQEEINKLSLNIENQLNRKENLLNDKKIKENILKKGYITPDERQIVRLKE